MIKQNEVQGILNKQKMYEVRLYDEIVKEIDLKEAIEISTDECFTFVKFKDERRKSFSTKDLFSNKEDAEKYFEENIEEYRYYYGSEDEEDEERTFICEECDMEFDIEEKSEEGLCPACVEKLERERQEELYFLNMEYERSRI